MRTIAIRLVHRPHLAEPDQTRTLFGGVSIGRSQHNPRVGQADDVTRTIFAVGNAKAGKVVKPQHECTAKAARRLQARSEEHTSEIQSLMRISYAVFCLKK